MPIYEFSCPSCGTTMEKIQKAPEADIPCPTCGGRAPRAVSRTSAGGSRGEGAPTDGCGGGGFT